MNCESSITSERCRCEGGLDSREWTDTASESETQLLNKMIELVRWGWSGVADSELHSEEIKAAGAWRERGRSPRPLRGLSCACFQASTDKSRPVHLVKQLATARSKSFKASTADTKVCL